MLDKAIIRHEHLGPLIWSPRLHSYYMLQEKDDAPAVRALIAGKAPAAFEAVAPSLRGELAQLGAAEGARHIHSPFTDRLSGPLEVYFDFTWVCNLASHKCGRDSFCYASDFLGKTTMALDRVRAIMHELAEWGVMRVHLAGGEPTSKKRDLANYLDSASASGLYTSMATNGLLCDEEVLEIVLRNHLKSISFSLDGATEETHGRIRGEGLFDRTVAAIRRTVRRRDEAGSQMRVCVKPTYEPSTPDEELERLVLLAIDLGADVIKFANPERCLHHEKGHYSTQVDAYYDKLAVIEDLKARYGLHIGITNVSNPLTGCGDIGVKGLEGCIGGQELIAINPDGSITPCLMHQYDLGNVLESGDLRTFWNTSDRLPAFWKALRKPEACRGCDMHSACRSGSTTRRIVEVGDFNARKTSGRFETVVDPLCPKRYLARHPDRVRKAVLPPPLRHFKEIAVRHSL